MQIDEFEREAQISVVLLGIEVRSGASALARGLFRQVWGRRAAGPAGVPAVRTARREGCASGCS